MFQQIDEGGVAQQRAAGDEPGERAHRGRIHVEAGPLAQRCSQCSQECPRHQHLPGRSHKAVHRQPRAARQKAAHGPGECAGPQSGDGPQERAVAANPATERRPQQSGQSGKPQQKAQPAARRQRLAAREQHFSQRNQKRSHRQHQRSQPAGNGLLRIHEAHVAPAQKQQADQSQHQHGSWRPVEAQPAPAAPAQQQSAGHEKPRSGQQQRRHLGRSYADGRIGRAPEEIDSGEGQNNGGRGGGFLCRVSCLGCGIRHGLIPWYPAWRSTTSRNLRCSCRILADARLSRVPELAAWTFLHG